MHRTFPITSRSRWKNTDAVVILILIASFAVSLLHLGHPAVTQWDESYHAIVARNLVNHPFTPTLIDHPYLPYDATDWGHNHIWLHKPIVALWQIALSFRLLGTSTFGLRLPSAVLNAMATGLTYLIGCRLLGRRAALIAALFQGICPGLLREVNGYLFADHVDIALLFWTELSIYFLIVAMDCGRGRYMIFCGVAQGIAFLSKSYPAGIVTGLALVAWLAPKFPLAKRHTDLLRGRHMLWMICGAACMVLPWTIYCAVRFPVEFRYEHVFVFRHLNQNLEGWGLPWYRVAYDFLFYLYGAIYTPILIALAAAMIRAITSRDVRIWLLIAWAFGVCVPFLLASTKTPSATILAIPALLLLLGYFVDRALSGDRLCLSLATAISIMCLLVLPLYRSEFWRDPAPWSILQSTDWPQAQWVVIHLAGTCILGGIFWIVLQNHKRILLVSMKACVVVTFSALAVGVACEWFAITQINLTRGACEQISLAARTRLNPNAVLVFDWKLPGDISQNIAFRSDLTCYSMDDCSARLGINDYPTMKARLRSSGAEPYLVSYVAPAHPEVICLHGDDLWIYPMPR